MIRQLSRNALLALVLGIIVSACGGGPTETEKLCTDPNAQNLGGPLPCVPKPPVVTQSVVEITSTSPVAGGSIKASTADAQGNIRINGELQINAKYGLSDNDRATVQPGEIVQVEICLSVDGVNKVTGTCVTKTIDHNVSAAAVSPIAISLVWGWGLPTITQTKHLLVSMYRVSPSTHTRHNFYSNRVDMVFNWVQ